MRPSDVNDLIHIMTIFSSTQIRGVYRGIDFRRVVRALFSVEYSILFTEIHYL